MAGSGKTGEIWPFFGVAVAVLVGASFEMHVAFKQRVARGQRNACAAHAAQPLRVPTGASNVVAFDRDYGRVSSDI
jgi:hypothetical protein